MGYYPVFLNISKKRCVVCGGGKVALRKVQALLDCGASVEVISPSSCTELIDMAKAAKLRIHSREYREGDLNDACVVIAATDNKETNAKIAGEGQRSGCLVNAVDDAESSDFIAPAYLKRGDITIAVSTSGKSPALARKLRTGLEKQVGPEYAELVRVVSEARMEIKHRELKVDENLWQDSIDLEALLHLVKEGKSTEAKDMIVRKLAGVVN